MGGLFYFYVLFIYHVPYCKRRRFLNKVLNYLGEMDIGATRPVPGKSQAFFFKKGGDCQLSYNCLTPSNNGIRSPTRIKIKKNKKSSCVFVGMLVG